MPGSWLHRFLERGEKGEIRKKGVRLGKFDKSPMLTTTLDLHGMKAKDALEVVERKLNRALQAGAKEIRVLHPEKDRKLKRSLHQFLSTHRVVQEFDSPDETPGVTNVLLI